MRRRLGSKICGIAVANGELLGRPQKAAIRGGDERIYPLYRQESSYSWVLNVVEIDIDFHVQFRNGR